MKTILSGVLLMVPLFVMTQPINQVLLVEDFDAFEFCLNSDDQIMLTYKKIWWHDNGNSEPSYDSSSIFLTRLDSLANPVGETWQLRHGPRSAYGQPYVTTGDNQVSWMYSHVEWSDSGSFQSIQAQLFDPQAASSNDPVILVEGIDDFIHYSQVSLSNDRYLLYWTVGSSHELRTILGQVFNQSNDVLGEVFTLYESEGSDSISARIDYDILASNSPASGMTYLLLKEYVWNISEFQHFTRLQILSLDGDGIPLGNPRVILEGSDCSYVKCNLYLQNDQDLILTYSKIEALDDFSLLETSWVHTLQSYGEVEELETIHQLPAHQAMEASFFSGTDNGVYLYREAQSDSMFAQSFDPSSGSVGDPLYLPVESNLRYPRFRCLEQEGLLYVFEYQVYYELYAHVFQLPDLTSLDPSMSIKPESFKRLEAYPNPFNPSTSIEYDLFQPSGVTLKVFDIQGHLIQTLVDDQQSMGTHSYGWDGSNTAGNQVSSGLFLVQLKADHFVKTIKLVLLH